MTMLQEALALEELPLEARAQAAEDRNFLAHLRASGRVRREDGARESRDPGVARAFVEDIERRAHAQGLAVPLTRNLALRPNPKKAKHRRR